MKTYKVKNYKGNLIESIEKFRNTYSKMKILEAKEVGEELEIKAEAEEDEEKEFDKSVELTEENLKKIKKAFSSKNKGYYDPMTPICPLSMRKKKEKSVDGDFDLKAELVFVDNKKEFPPFLCISQKVGTKKLSKADRHTHTDELTCWVFVTKDLKWILTMDDMPRDIEKVFKDKQKWFMWDHGNDFDKWRRAQKELAFRSGKETEFYDKFGLLKTNAHHPVVKKDGTVEVTQDDGTKKTMSQDEYDKIEKEVLQKEFDTWQKKQYVEIEKISKNLRDFLIENDIQLMDTSISWEKITKWWEIWKKDQYKPVSTHKKYVDVDDFEESKKV